MLYYSEGKCYHTSWGEYAVLRGAGDLRVGTGADEFDDSRKREYPYFLTEVRMSSVAGSIKPFEKIIVGAAVYFLQFDHHADTDIQFTGFIFLVSAASDITATALQFRAQFFLRKTVADSHFSQIISHVAITPEFLFQANHPV